MTDLAAQITQGRTVCTRCGAALSPYTTDACIWCRRALCPQCYRTWGHCGEPEVVELLNRLAERQRLLAAYRAGSWNADRLGKFYGLRRLSTVTQYAKLFGLGRYSRAGYFIDMSPAEAERFGEALTVCRRRREPAIFYRPPWPEWLRVHWRKAGYAEPPLKP